MSFIERENRYCVGEACPGGKRITWVEPIPTGRNGEYISVMSLMLITQSPSP